MSKTFMLLVVLISLAAKANCQYSTVLPYTYDANPCPLGQYSSCPNTMGGTTSPTTAAGATSCAKCPLGMSSLGRDDYGLAGSTCQWCPPGYYANTTGSFTCQECPEGSVCPDPMRPPIPCPKGTAYSAIYTEGTTNPRAASCTPCPIGTYANKVGSTKCTQCPLGYQCADPTISPVPCPKGEAYLYQELLIHADLIFF